MAKPAYCRIVHNAAAIAVGEDAAREGISARQFLSVRIVIVVRAVATSGSSMPEGVRTGADAEAADSGTVLLAVRHPRLLFDFHRPIAFTAAQWSACTHVSAKRAPSVAALSLASGAEAVHDRQRLEGAHDLGLLGGKTLQVFAHEHSLIAIRRRHRVEQAQAPGPALHRAAAPCTAARRARLGPTSWKRSVPPPQAVAMFSRACRKPIRACAAAIRRSHASASSAPPPSASPLSTAMTGTGKRLMVSSAVRVSRGEG